MSATTDVRLPRHVHFIPISHQFPVESNQARLVSRLYPEGSPVKICQTHKHGRFLVASRDLKPGDLLFSCAPVACVVHNNYLEHVCAHCFKSSIDCRNGDSTPVKLVYACEGCEQVFFCSPACLSEHCGGGGVHDQMHCSVLKRLAAAEPNACPRDTSDARMLLQLLQLKGRSKARFDEVMGLVSNVDAGLDTAKHEATVSLLRSCGGSGLLDDAASQPFATTGVHLLGRVQCNSQAISDFQDQCFGMGLFPAGALLNHSCMPNCHYTRAEGRSIEVRAIEPIATGATLSICYQDLYQPTRLRQASLRKSYCFTCDCPRCTERFSEVDLKIGSFRCPQGTCDGLLVPAKKGEGEGITESVTDEGGRRDTLCATLVCRKCRVSRSRDLYERVEAETARILEALKEQNGLFGENATKVKSACMSVFKDMGGLLSPNHWLLFNLYTLCSGACQSLNEFPLAVAFCKKAVACVDVCYSQYHPRRATYRAMLLSTLLTLGVTAGKPAYIREATTVCESMIDVLVVACGDEHVDVAGVREQLDAIRLLS